MKLPAYAKNITKKFQDQYTGLASRLLEAKLIQLRNIQRRKIVETPDIPRDKSLFMYFLL